MPTQLPLTGFADNSAVSINSEMEVMGSAPLLAMAAFVQEDPEYSSLQRWFYPVARKLLMAVGGRASWPWAAAHTCVHTSLLVFPALL